MSGVRRLSAGIQASSRSFVREPFTLVLLLVLPALSVQLYGVSLSQFPAIGFFDAAAPLETTGRITGAVFATAALAGVIGLFQMISARQADHRLATCGFSAIELLGSRFATVAVVGGVVAGVTTVTLVVLLETAVGSPPIAFAGLALAGLAYGLLGMLVGSVLSRDLEGSLVLVILADVDNVFASGLFGIEDRIARFAPLSHPHEIVTRAVVDGTLAADHVLPALAHVLAFAVLGIGAYAYRLERGED